MQNERNETAEGIRRGMGTLLDGQGERECVGFVRDWIEWRMGKQKTGGSTIVWFLSYVILKSSISHQQVSSMSSAVLPR